MRFGCSKVLEYPQQMFRLRNRKNKTIFSYTLLSGGLMYSNTKEDFQIIGVNMKFILSSEVKNVYFMAWPQLKYTFE